MLILFIFYSETKVILVLFKKEKKNPNSCCIFGYVVKKISSLNAVSPKEQKALNPPDLQSVYS